MIDYYNLLGVNPSARPEEIRAAFRRLAKRAHPDAQPNLAGEEKEASHRRFIRLAQAYETLSDPGRRRDYDRKLRAARMRSPSQPGRTAPRPGRAAEAGAKAGGRPKAGTARQHGSGGPGPRPSQPRPAPPPREPPPRDAAAKGRGAPGGAEQDLEDLLQDVEGLLNRFGLDMRNQFGEMLDKMLDWALAVFLEVVQALESSSAPQGSGQGAGRPTGGGAEADGEKNAAQPGPRPGPASSPPPPPQPPPGERELEQELDALKRQVHTAVQRAEREKATPESVEEELERIKEGLKRRP